MYRIGRIAALVACIMHALVLPALSASMKSAQAVSGELARASSVICHTIDLADVPGPATGSAGIPGKATSAPVDGSTKDAADDCQICKGLAAVQFAVLVSVVLGLVETPAPAVFARPDSADAAGIAFTAIRNRGPPHLV